MIQTYNKHQEISWIDLDATLILTTAMWWIINKQDPTTYLFRISQYEGSLIKNGFYQHENLPIYYNGSTGYLNQAIWNKIQRIKKIPLSDIGLSFREYTDETLINQQLSHCIFYIDRFKSLKNHTINILTARGNKHAHLTLLDILQQNMSEIGLIINESCFVNDPKQINFGQNSAEKKLYCIIEKIVGYQIKDTEFIPIMNDSYQISNFYDDEDINIDLCQDINKYITVLLSNTESWLRNKIKKTIQENKPILYTHLVTSNEVNPFTIKKIPIMV